MGIDSEFTSVLETAGDTIDALYGGKRTNVRISTLPTEYLESLRFDVNLISRVLEEAVAERRDICTKPTIGKPPHCGDATCFRRHEERA